MPASLGPARVGVRAMATLPDYVQAVVMPALSPTMSTGKVSKWHVEAQSKVEPGSVLCLIETDKASLDFEVQDEGFIAQLLVEAGTGDDIPVGKPIALMVEDEANLPKAMALDVSELLGAGKRKADAGGGPQGGPGSGKESAPVTSAAAVSQSAHLDPTRIMPAARHMVESLHINPAVILGTGKRGRITKGDVLAFLRAGNPQHERAADAAAPSASPASPSTPAGAIASAATATPLSTPVGWAAPAAAGATPVARPAATATASTTAPAAPSSLAGREVQDQVPSQMRKVIARRLTESKQTVPHTYATAEVELDELLRTRSQLKAAGASVSVNDMIVRAVGLALRDMPAVNAYYDDASGTVRARKEVDVSVAVATEGGLITPIVRGVDERGLSSIAEEVRALATRARDNKLLPHEYQGGSFSVSNLGMFGIDEFSAVINPPQAGILAVSQGAAQVVVRDVEEEVVDATTGGKQRRLVPRAVTRTIMSVTLSADRRVVDEAQAAQFLQLVTAYLQGPARMAV